MTSGKEILEAKWRKPSDEDRSELIMAVHELGERVVQRRRFAEYQRLNFGRLD